MPSQALVTLTVGTAATVGVVVTWQQKNIADRSPEWWRRAAWAFERSLSANDVEARLGWRVLRTLVGFKLATKNDSDVVQVIAEHVALDEDKMKDDKVETPSKSHPAKRSDAVRKAAAQAAVAASAKTKRPVDPRVKELAESP